MKVIFDTSVLVAAARSSQGASFALISALPSKQFQICLSVALYVEWQAVLTRAEHLPLNQEVENFMSINRAPARYLLLMASTTA